MQCGVPEQKDLPPIFHPAIGLGSERHPYARLAEHDTAADATSIEQLAEPRFKGKIGMARPTAGTTGGFVAALYVAWGDEKADQFFRALRAERREASGRKFGRG